MTASAPTSGPASDATPAKPDLVNLIIDGLPVAVPKGTLIIRAAEEVGIHIPRFCDHPLLEPVGACRQCLVEVAMPGPPGPDGTPGAPRQMQGPPGRMKPQPSCTMTVAEGMDVKTQFTSAGADKAQHGVMEMLLINHPLDCPVCDKGGECPLQNQAMSNGRPTSRYVDIKRTYAKPINISSQVLLDRERCILCARCTRFSDQIAGDPFIALIERGALQQVGIYETQPFESYFSGNTVQICPVGALTGAAYRFRSRPFDLVSSASVCEHCASGCSLRTDHRRGVVLRRMALEDPDVNEEWNCDKGRWAFQYATLPDRLTMPMVRNADGDLVVTGWPEALAAAAAGLRGVATGVLTGGRITAEDAYAYSKFARIVLGTNDIDFRARAHSASEAQFLAAHVAATSPEAGAVTYADLEKARTVVLAGFEPEDESPIVFLRLRKTVRRNQTAVLTIAPFASRGSTKLSATVVATAPGDEVAALSSDQVRTALADGGVILVGERLALVPGALAAAAALADTTGAALAWVPRRAGERGALETGAIGSLLPGGRPVADPAARAEVAAAWGVAQLPTEPGRDTAAILAAAASGELGALVVGGVDPADLGPVAEVSAALAKPFVVSLEIRSSAVTDIADVVLPVAPVAEKSGTFVNWEGRLRGFETALRTGALSDHQVLDLLAAELGEFLGTRSIDQVHEQFERLGPWTGARGAGAATGHSAPAHPADGTGLVLATWATLLDSGRLQDGEPYLAGTAPEAVARLSAATAAQSGIADDDLVTVSSTTGAVTVPARVTDGMLDGVLWLPTNSAGCNVPATLGLQAGSRVAIAAAQPEQELQSEGSLA